MTTKKKVVSVAKKTTVEDKLNAVRWEQFIIHSGIRFEDLSSEWVAFFDAQAEISTAQTELVKLIDLAIQADVEKLK